MSAVVERAFAAAAERDYTGAETRALIRMALDADHETGENCVTSLARVHEAAGYADDGERYRTARRTLQRFQADGVIRCEVDVAGIGRVFTVCPTAPWSGNVTTRTTLGRKLATWLERRSSPDVRVSGADADPTPGVKTPGAPLPPPDLQASGVTPDLQASGVDVLTPDTAPDVSASGDQRTERPEIKISPPTPPPAAPARGRSHRHPRGSRANGTNPRALAANAAAQRQANRVTPLDDDGCAAWKAMRAELERATVASAWAQWLEPLTALGLDGRELVLATPADPTWVARRYGRLLQQVLDAVAGPGMSVQLVRRSDVAPTTEPLELGVHGSGLRIAGRRAA